MANLDPDELCAVCGTARDQHGDKQHEFNLDGQLIQKRPAEPPKNTPPAARGAESIKVASDPVARLVLRLTERLVARGFLDGEDMLLIFGGTDASDHGPAQEGASATDASPSPK